MRCFESGDREKKSIERTRVKFAVQQRPLSVRERFHTGSTRSGRLPAAFLALIAGSERSNALILKTGASELWKGARAVEWTGLGSAGDARWRHAP